MNIFWGDESWRGVAYKEVPGFFGSQLEKSDNETIAEAFRNRLKAVAGFKYVPKPLHMKNSKGAIVYYLFFASHNNVGQKIADYIFNKYRKKGY